ncbi:MAG: hypothetical protein L3J06_05845 [Cyclobacteriaceae bacterium]|nr:hypothetical protein [Cyclobacteriaceae bacterium]
MENKTFDIVEEKATEFVRWNLDSANSTDEFISDLESELYKFNREKDKLSYLTVISAFVLEESNKHSEECTRPKNCTTSKRHREATFFINQMLEEYEIGINNDQVFSFDEKYENNRKLDSLIEEVQKLRTGQEIIYDDLIKEIEELKNLYFIGKKNWYQNLAGKSFEMVASGVVSEAISKKLLTIAGTTFTNLIGS